MCACVFLQIFGILESALAKNAVSAGNSELKHFMSEVVLAVLTVWEMSVKVFSDKPKGCKKLGRLLIVYFSDAFQLLYRRTFKKTEYLQIPRCVYTLIIMLRPNIRRGQRF